MRLCMATVILGLAATAGVARAQGAPGPGTEQPLPPALGTMLARPDHITALQRASRAVDPPGLTPCPAASYVTTGEIGILMPLQTDEKGQVTGGMIKESVRETGCGPERVLNALTMFEPNGTMQTRPLLPGNTITDPQLQQDSVPYAAGAMGAMPPGCEQGGVVNTRFAGLDGKPAGTRPIPGGPPQPWTEVWSLQACARHADVTIHFKPDQTGTEIRADPLK